jgi:hypothetical protein
MRACSCSVESVKSPVEPSAILSVLASADTLSLKSFMETSLIKFRRSRSVEGFNWTCNGIARPAGLLTISFTILRVPDWAECHPQMYTVSDGSGPFHSGVPLGYPAPRHEFVDAVLRYCQLSRHRSELQRGAGGNHVVCIILSAVHVALAKRMRRRAAETICL